MRSAALRFSEVLQAQLDNEVSYAALKGLLRSLRSNHPRYPRRCNHSIYPSLSLTQSESPGKGLSGSLKTKEAQGLFQAGFNREENGSFPDERNESVNDGCRHGDAKLAIEPSPAIPSISPYNSRLRRKRKRDRAGVSPARVHKSVCVRVRCTDSNAWRNVVSPYCISVGIAPSMKASDIGIIVNNLIIAECEWRLGEIGSGAELLNQETTPANVLWGDIKSQFGEFGQVLNSFANSLSIGFVDNDVLAAVCGHKRERSLPITVFYSVQFWSSMWLDFLECSP